jgi:hypothetical protein
VNDGIWRWLPNPVWNRSVIHIFQNISDELNKYQIDKDGALTLLKLRVRIFEKTAAYHVNHGRVYQILERFISWLFTGRNESVADLSEKIIRTIDIHLLNGDDQRLFTQNSLWTTLQAEYYDHEVTFEEECHNIIDYTSKMVDTLDFDFNDLLHFRGINWFMLVLFAPVGFDTRDSSFFEAVKQVRHDYKEFIKNNEQKFPSEKQLKKLAKDKTALYQATLALLIELMVIRIDKQQSLSGLNSDTTYLSNDFIQMALKKDKNDLFVQAIYVALNLPDHSDGAIPLTEEQERNLEEFVLHLRMESHPFIQFFFSTCVEYKQRLPFISVQTRINN